MSRIGKIPVSIPKGVEIKISQRTLSVKGPKGTLSMEIMLGLEVAIQNDEVLINGIFMVSAPKRLFFIWSQCHFRKILAEWRFNSDPEQ